MPANDSWMYQGRQEHGEFGHGTSPKTHPGVDSTGASDLFQPANAGQRVEYVAASLVGHAPRAERNRWATGAHGAAVGDLKTATAAWYASAKLSRDSFRDRFLDPSVSDATVDALRDAARGMVDARSHDDLARAGDRLASAALPVGPDRWPRFIGTAARNAVKAVDAGSVPGVIRANAADTSGGLILLGILGVAGALYLGTQRPQPSPAAVPSIAENRRPPQDAKDPNGAKAPGKPGAAEEFEDPRGGERWVPNPNGSGYGWEDKKGRVWVPTGPASKPLAHGGPHWDVQEPGGRYRNVRPGQKWSEAE